MKRVASAGFKVGREDSGVERAEDFGEGVGFERVVAAQCGVAPTGDDERAVRRGGGRAEIGGEFEVECAGGGGREAAGVRQDVETGGRGGKFGGEGRDIPRGDDGDIAHGLRAGGVVVEDDERATGSGGSGGVDGEHVVRPDGRERGEGRALGE